MITIRKPTQSAALFDLPVRTYGRCPLGSMVSAGVSEVIAEHDAESLVVLVDVPLADIAVDKPYGDNVHPQTMLCATFDKLNQLRGEDYD